VREEEEEKKTHIPLSSSKPQSTFILSFNIVFSNWPYIIISAITATIFWITSSIFDQLLFFSPIVIFYLPEDAILGFILANITAVLLGIVVSLNIYVIRNSKQKIDAASLFSGSSIGVLSSTCASCSSLGFFLISALGATGVTASAFLSNYQMPLRLLSIALLIWAYYTISIKLTKSCVTNYKNEIKQ
jgi:hypothetical protein